MRNQQEFSVSLEGQQGTKKENNMSPDSSPRLEWHTASTPEDSEEIEMRHRNFEEPQKVLQARMSKIQMPTIKMMKKVPDKMLQSIFKD